MDDILYRLNKRKCSEAVTFKMRLEGQGKDNRVKAGVKMRPK